MNYNFINLEVKNRIAYVTITREKALNALNLEVINELFHCFRRINQMNEVGCVIFTGAGRSFIAGADIGVMSNLAGIDGRDFTKIGQELMDYVEALRIPVIAAINGFALGGGCEFAMACDIRIASTKAKFGQPEVNLGIIPGYGGTQRLPRLIGKGMAKYLIMTGETIEADEAYRIGLVQKVVEPEKLIEEAEKVATTILSKAPVSIKVAKCAINTAQDTDMRSGIAYELEAYDTTFHTEDRVEGMKAFVEKRQAEFKNR